MVQLERRNEHRVTQKVQEAGGFPGGPVFKNLTSNAGVGGSFPVWGTKVHRALEQLSSRATTRGEAPLLQQRPRTARKRKEKQPNFGKVDLESMEEEVGSLEGLPVFWLG